MLRSNGAIAPARHTSSRTRTRPLRDRAHRVDLDELALMVDGLERVARGEAQPYRLRIALDARQLCEAREQLAR
jgi:hypothetical protein